MSCIFYVHNMQNTKFKHFEVVEMPKSPQYVAIQISAAKFQVSVESTTSLAALRVIRTMTFNYTLLLSDSFE